MMPPRAWSRRLITLWGAVLIVLCAWVAARLGLFDLTVTVVRNGIAQAIPNTFSSVDHPFHESRAAMLLQSLREGHALRWLGQHQGGYPAEFYPLGIPWLDFIVWLTLIGSIPIVAVHKIVVILIFLLPVVSFWLAARGDRLHPSTALFAAAIHIAVPGSWLNGGFTELIGWGLVTNVAGGTFSLLASVLLIRAVLNKEFRLAPWATGAAALAALSNPRSLFSLVTVALAILIVGLISREELTILQQARRVVAGVGVIGGLAFLITAPVVLALFRYNGLYFFKHYQNYANWAEYRHAMVLAVSSPGFVMAVIGIMVGLIALVPALRLRLTVTTTLVVAGLLYGGLTMWVSSATNVPPLVEQLEAPRLMPFQRQLMIWLAAAGVIAATEWGTRRAPAWLHDALPSVISVGMAAWYIASWVLLSTSGIPEERGLPIPGETLDANGLPFVGLSNDRDYADFEDAVAASSTFNNGQGGTLVIGNKNEWWHEQIWAPAFTSDRLYYDDWMWYWHTRQNWPYTPDNGYFVPDPAQMLQAPYLQAHGIRAVIVTDMYVDPGVVPPRQAARTAPTLSPVATFGAWDLYRVLEPGSIITLDSQQPVSVRIANERITARFAEPGETITLRQNWYPRWQATVNDQPAEITRRDDGYMDIAVPANTNGPVTVIVSYSVTGLDWISRSLSVLGIGGTVALVILRDHLPKRFRLVSDTTEGPPPRD